MLAFSNDYYGMIFRATQSVELFCAYSIAILDLNRSELIERRKEKIENLLPLVDKWKKETNETYKKLLYSQIKKEAESDKEFSFTVQR